MLRLLLLVLCSVLWLNAVNGKVYRLPTNIKPIRYELTLQPKLTIPQNEYHNPVPYSGSVVMHLEILENTRNITFHKKYLEIDQGSIEILHAGGDKLKFVDTFENEIEETYTIQLEKDLVKNEKYTLNINSFNNNLTRDGLGFFKAVYYVQNNETGDSERRILAATHFQPSGARIAFPCFDEPALKAKFVVNLIREESYNSISNEALESTKELENGLFKDTFKETPIMSTYTLAFAVTQYKFASSGTFRIFAEDTAIDNHHADYALDISIKTLKALEDYTGIDFVIDKMDQLAVPDAYFRYHAMENWGLVIYGKSHLIRNNDSYDDTEDYQRTTIYIAHEFGHQWFGNLVTPAWWDYIWIGESFAAYFQYYTAAIVQPTWRLTDQFVIDVVQESFNKEETEGAHPLNYEVEYSGQYPPFHIMYEKGSTIVRMMEHFLTPKLFRKGLNIYLNKNKFKAALPSDLYDALQEAVDKTGSNRLLKNMTVGEIMKTWDSTKGYPIVTVTRNYETGSITIEQRSRFDKDTIWTIPINFVFSADGKTDFSKTHADIWLTQKSITINDNFPKEGWLLVNSQQTGYYRVNYDTENWERIIQYLKTDKFKKIHVLNRAQLLNDVYYFARNGGVSWNIALTLGEYMESERDYIPVAAFESAVQNYLFDKGDWYYHNRKASESDVFQNYSLINTIGADANEIDLNRAYMRRALSGLLSELGSKPRVNDTHLEALTRRKLRYYFYYFPDLE